MTRLLRFELKKIWHRKLWIVPALLFLTLLLWVIVGGYKLIAYRYSSNYRIYESTTRPYWGMSITEELKAKAREEALALGAEEGYFGNYSAASLRDKYGQDSVAYALANFWCDILNTPTEQESREQYEEIMRFETQKYREDAENYGSYRFWQRASHPALQQIVPGISVWRFWLNTVDYLPLILGLGALGLILYLLSPVFSMEENGGLREVSVSQPKARLWIASKTVAAMVSGAGVVTFLYVGSFFILGLLFGFHGWNCSPLGYIAGGYAYGELYHGCTCLSLTAIRMLVLILGGAFMGLTVAACSAFTRNSLSAAGCALALCTAMESFLFIVGAVWQWMGKISHPLLGRVDWMLLKTVCTTPIRLFLNVEVLTAQVPQLASAYDNQLIHNIMITPDLRACYLVGMAAVMGILFALIMRNYGRN